MSSDPIIKYGMLCDQIRREDNGKLIVIGVYGNNVIAPMPSDDLAVTILVALSAEGPTTCDLKIAGYLDEKEIISGGGPVTISGPGLGMVGLPRIPLKLQKEGRLSFKAKIGDGEWTELWAGQFKAKNN